MTIPADVLYGSKQFQEWLSELKEKAYLATHNQSYAMLRAVLHELRGHQTVAQAAAFGDALPPLVRGIFYENWRPLEPPAQLRTQQEFVDAVTRRLAPHHVPPDSIVSDVLGLLARRTDAVDRAVAREQMPEALKPLWDNGTPASAK